MFFVLSIFLMAVSVLGLGVCYVGARNPKKPKWAADFLMGSVYVPLIMTLFSLSAASFIRFVSDYGIHPLTIGQGLAGLAVVCVSAILWRMMGFKKRVRAYEQKDSGTVVPVDFQQQSLKGDPPPSSGRTAA